MVSEPARCDRPLNFSCLYSLYQEIQCYYLLMHPPPILPIGIAAAMKIKIRRGVRRQWQLAGTGISAGPTAGLVGSAQNSSLQCPLNGFWDFNKYLKENNPSKHKPHV